MLCVVLPSEELLRLSVQELSGLLARPEQLQHRVHEVETALLRYTAHTCTCTLYILCQSAST